MPKKQDLMLRCTILENKIKAKLNTFINGDTKKVKIIVAVGLIGMVLILLSDVFFGGSAEKPAENAGGISSGEYTQQLEVRLTDVISSIDGVGECRVMITLQNTAESVYATNYESKSDSESSSHKDEYVLYDSSGGETPVLIKEYMPGVQGVTVVCSGGDDIKTKEKIIGCVTSLFNIPANRVSVTKIKS